MLHVSEPRNRSCLDSITEPQGPIARRMSHEAQPWSGPEVADDSCSQQEVPDWYEGEPMNRWKRRNWTMVLVGMGLLILADGAPAQTAPKSSFLEGDVRLSCECLLCLAAGPQAPKECKAALTKYYMIQAGSPFKT